VRFEQIERLLLQAAVDETLADDLVRSGVSAGDRYLLDTDERELMTILQRDEGAVLQAIFRAIRAGMDSALLTTMESMPAIH
jgi:hypothetical protein